MKNQKLDLIPDVDVGHNNIPMIKAVNVYIGLYINVAIADFEHKKALAKGVWAA